MRKKIFTFLLALAASVGMMNAKVTWNSSNIGNLFVYGTYESYSMDGVTLSANADHIIARWEGYGDESHSGIFFMTDETGGFTFSNTLGKNFTKIEMTLNGPAGWDHANLGSGWLFNWNYGAESVTFTVTWTGNASTVDLVKDESHFHGENVKRIEFYFEGDSEEPDPTYTVALEAGTANANKVTLSKTSAVEGATITVTPDDEYEITAFSAKYNTTEEAPSTLDPGTGAYSFTMPAANVTIEATIAEKPVPEGDIFAGFTATAGSGGFNNEGHANLVDNKFISSDWTKWCADNSYKSVPMGETGDACWWIDFEASEALNPTGYILTTGNDTGNEHGRNPKNWVLKAKLNADDAWTTIATVTNDVTMKNKSFKDYKFFVDQSGTYQYFRFEVFANQGANVMQLCELRLIGAEPQLAVANTLQLHVNDALMGSVTVTNLLGSGIVDNGDGTYDVPEGAAVTLIATPNEGYEFIGWKASSSICDFNECEFVDLHKDENPLTFDMNVEVAFMAEFAAVAPQPQPAEDVDITPNVDPENPTFYYSTFFDSSVKYELPENVEAYIVTTVSGDAMQLQKVAEAGQTIPAGAGVILKSRVNGFTLAPSDADAVSVEGNRLEGSDVSIATPANCYVLSCKNDLVGFYHYNGANLNPHKAYIIYAPNSGNQAPQRLRFVFDQATGVENVQGNVQSTKVIENGVLYIIKNGAKYNAQGQVVK